jgi:hypothetical protein
MENNVSKMGFLSKDIWRESGSNIIFKEIDILLESTMENLLYKKDLDFQWEKFAKLENSFISDRYISTMTL